jgi:hypothetical protein
MLLWRICVAGWSTTSLGLHVLLSDLNKIWSFPARLSYKFPVSSFAEICPVSAALIHAEQRKEGRGTANRRFSQVYEGTSEERPMPRPR